MTLIIAISVDEVRQGLPIVVQDPVEMLLSFGVLVLLVVPLYLAHRRRVFQRSVDGR